MNLKDTLVSDLMSTAIMTGKLDETLDIAEFDMKTAGIRHLLVMDSQNRLAGIVSDRDILRAVGGGANKKLVLGAVMSTGIITISEDSYAHQALEIFLERKINCLPVEGEDGQMVGIITATDFLRMIQEDLFGQIVAA